MSNYRLSAYASTGVRWQCDDGSTAEILRDERGDYVPIINLQDQPQLTVPDFNQAIFIAAGVLGLLASGGSTMANMPASVDAFYALLKEG